MFRLPWLFSLLALTASQAHAVDYQRHVRPLLDEKCISCHGTLRQEAELRLDAGALVHRGGESGAVLDAQQPHASELLVRVTSEDPDVRMPPPDEGTGLTPEEQDLLSQWIAAGAPYPAEERFLARPEDHWAYQPVRRPTIDAGSGAEHPIDQLLARPNDREPSFPLAPPRVRLRRLYFSLIGLPPPVDDQRHFASHPSPSAWLQQVDQLLASPAYGERWGRHWMDIWRYSDWDGFKNQLRGSQRHIWRWRDWIVESLNADKGYDAMLREMLAGDELAPDNLDVIRATGYLARNYHHSNRDIWLDATVEHTAKAFLAMTVACARCHDHKYDPIDQQEYYALRAVFEPHHVRTERLPGEANLIELGLARVYDKQLEEPTYLYVNGDEKRPNKDRPMSPGVPHALPGKLSIQTVSLPLHASHPDTRDFVRAEAFAAAAARVDAAAHQLASAGPNEKANRTAAWQLAVAQQAALSARWEADLARLVTKVPPARQSELNRAAHQAEREAERWALEYEVAQQREAAGTGDEQQRKQARDSLRKAEEKRDKLPEVDLAAEEYQAAIASHPRHSSGRRLAFARWLTHRDHPLTARVCVNHIWLRHFGQPLVENVFDFGLRTPTPRHLALLDFLAAELVDSEWSMKHLHRCIVTSRAFQQHSGPSPTDAWSAMPPRRLEAEVIRDSVLAVSGQLQHVLGGPELDHLQGERQARRSMYFRQAYEKQMLLLTVFDGAATTECYRRQHSIIPQQALALANSRLVMEAARRVGQHLSPQYAEDAAFIRAAFELLLGRLPRDAEQTACQHFLEGQPARLPTVERENMPDVAYVPPAVDPRERARENLIHVLFNHHDFITLR